MQRRTPGGKPGKKGTLLRRSAALLLACCVGAALSQTSGAGRLRRFLGHAVENGALARAILSAELGYVPGGTLSAALDGWETLVLTQSAVLRAGEAGMLSLQEQADAPEPTASPVVPTPQPVSSPVPSSNSEVIARTFLPISSTNYDQADGVYIFNRTSQTVDVAALSQTPPELGLQKSDAPQVLIVHTHGSEAYHPEGDDQYIATGEARTTDTNYNVVRVGQALKTVLEENGIAVIHDTTLHDYPAYQGSYDRSLQSVQRYLEQYPTIRVVLDLHRDALIGTDGTIYKPVTTIDGKQVAQVMLVMGSNDGGLEHPHWQENVRFAIWLQKQLNMEYPTLARPMSLRTSRYNQQLSKGALLVEVGGHGNSLQEALGAIRLFGMSLANLLHTFS